MGRAGAALSGQIDRYRHVPQIAVIPDTAEVLLEPDGLGDGSQLFFDVVELVTVGLERLGIVDRLGRQALVAQSES